MDEIDLFMDSGAHSIFNKEFAGISHVKGEASRLGAHYEYFNSKTFKDYLNKYIEFLHTNKHLCNVYVNLDIIFNAEKSWETQKYMESCGLKPLPVFHFGEDIKWLKKYMDDYDYIGIGGLGQDVTKEKFIQLMGDPVFTCICDDKGNPAVKTHGFALTAVDLIIRYPWFSVDSTTWKKAGAFGYIIVPYKNGNKYLYDRTPKVVHISSQSSYIEQEGLHFQNMTQGEQTYIRDYLESINVKYGESKFREEDETYQLKPGENWVVRGANLLVETVVESGVINDYFPRDEANIAFFLELENTEVGFGKKTFDKRRRGFFL